jgi:hypothetical protein
MSLWTSRRYCDASGRDGVRTLAGFVIGMRLMRSRVPDLDKVKPDTPLRLDVAAALAYPDGSMTSSGLRKEAERGRLVIERVAGKDYTTLSAIQKMREECRVQPRGPVSGCAPKNEIPTALSASAPYGSSEMDRARSARAALQKIAQARSAPSASTSPENISRTEPVVVISLKS